MNKTFGTAYEKLAKRGEQGVLLSSGGMRAPHYIPHPLETADSCATGEFLDLVAPSVRHEASRDTGEMYDELSIKVCEL